MNSSTSSLLWRLFAVVCLLLLLSLAANLRQHYLNGDLSKKYFETKNYYKTAQDSIRRTRAVPRPPAVRRSVSLSPAALVALRTGLRAAVSADLREELRREFRNQNTRLLAGQHVAVVTQQVLPTVAMKDTTLRRVSPKTGQIVAKSAKTGTFRDPWLSLTGVVIPGQPGKADSLQVKYYVRNDFAVRAYSKRTAKHWYQFWKGRTVYVDLQNQNPNATTTKMEAVEVEKR
ncbi:MAG: hypothetical protein ACRYG7_46245 [Janthinobacterium lividum]